MTLTLLFELEIVHTAKDYFYLYYTDPTGELFRFGWNINNTPDNKNYNPVNSEEQRQTKEWITNLIARQGANMYAADNVFNTITQACNAMQEDGLKQRFLPIYKELIGA